MFIYSMSTFIQRTAEVLVKTGVQQMLVISLAEYWNDDLQKTKRTSFISGN